MEGIGRLVYILLPMFIFQFVASPLSNTLAILGKQKLMLQIDFIRFSFFVALVAAVNFYISDFFTFCWRYIIDLLFCISHRYCFRL